MGKFNYNLYTAISSMTQENLHQSLKTFLTKRYSEDKVVEMEEHFLFAIGNIPICLVAHLDTVHKRLPHEIFFDQSKNVIWSPQGLGADDRAGVYAILELVKRGLRPCVLFTWDEETGGYGATQAGQLLKDLGCVDFCIELDRRGQNDSVYYECDNPDFEEYINSFGFETAIGSFSDICFICPEWGVAGVNLSIGYENEHTLQEILRVDWMMNTIDKVEKICYNKSYDKEKFKFIQLEYKSSFDEDNWWSSFCSTSYTSKSSVKSNGYDFAYTSSYTKKPEQACDCCGQFVPGYKIIPINEENICERCYDLNYDYCTKCSSIFSKHSNCECEK